MMHGGCHYLGVLPTKKGCGLTGLYQLEWNPLPAGSSTFDRLGHWVQTPQKEEEWEPRPEMTPRKVDRGCQSSRTAGSEPPRSTSQKRQSQS